MLVSNPVMIIRKSPPGRAKDRRLAIEAGMRRGGTLGLTCKGVDSDSRIIHLKDTKNS